MQMEEIKAIVKMMREYSLTEFKIEAEGCNLSISRAPENVPAPQVVLPAASVQAPVAVAATPAAPAPAPAPAAESAPAAPREQIESPLVGTFYRAASPEAKPFVSVGDKVDPDTVVGIIEAMKVMNEIKAEKRGEIREILVENGDPVEYGQPLFVIA